jgi:ornithine cyclodeaminase/alanine dehydrogenase-like protein (mu-crystallin family)
MQDQSLLYLSRADVEGVGVTMAEIIDAVEAGFREHGEARVEMPPKPGVHPRPDSFLHAMPAWIPALHSVGIKWVSGYPDNQAKGEPYIMGLLILNDEETGRPLAVMDCTWITAKRTGAATAVAAKYLARPESETVGILGCGVQGRSNLEALRVLLPLRRVRAYDVVPAVAERFVDGGTWNVESGVRGLEMEVARSPREAVEGADLVVTAGPILKQPHATIQAGWLAEGAFASLVDYDSYWAPAALGEVDKFCTDDVPQFEHYRSLGYFQDTPPIYATVGELVAGLRPGRETASERTMTCNLGLALDDMATAPLVYQRAVERGLGTRLEL